VDASYSTIGWARENQAASQLDDKPIRWILDDALKFVEREARRGTKYDAIIMDPPPYGHGPNGEKWEFNQSFPKLMSEVQKILSDNPLFVIVNGYAITPSPQTLENVLHDYLKNYQGEYES
jgi:23S rRNA (cytosine1962-C5)-methyltransferase